VLTRALTPRRAAAVELLQRETRFHHLVDAIIDYAIFVLDVGGHVSTWNPGAARAKGYTAEEIVGQHFSVFYTPADRAAGKPERVLDAARSDGHYEEEGWRVRKDGSQFWANVTVTALRDDAGNVVGFAKVTRDLTEKLRSEEALRKSEERFRLLVDSVEDYAIYMLDLAGNVTTWNRGAERMKGYRAEEIVGQSFAVFFPEQDVKDGKPARELATALQDGRTEDEGWRLRKDGTRFWANATLTALRDERGEHVGFAKVTRDLTARRDAEERARQLVREHAARAAAEHAEQRIRESEERYRGLSGRLEVVFENVADCIMAEDQAGRIVFANAAAASMFGYGSTQELLASSPADFRDRFQLLGEEGAAVPSHRLPSAIVLGGERTSSALLELRSKQRRGERWVFVRAGNVLGPDGQPELAISIWHDVTAERQQERQAKYLAEATAALGTSLDQREMLGHLAESLIPGLADWCSIHLAKNAEVRCLAVAHANHRKSAALEDYFQKFPEPSDAGLLVRVLQSGASEIWNDIEDEALARAAKTPERLALLRKVGVTSILVAPIHVRTRVLGAICLVNAESKRAYEWTQVALAEELGRRAGVAIENAELYADAQRAVRAAEQASRAKDEFLATVSHELRTPLGAILGWSQILKDRVTDLALKKPLEVVHRNALAQVRIIDDILEVSRIITGKFRIDPKPTDLVAITRDAIEAVRPSASAKQIDIQFQSTASYRLLVADPDRLQQAIWNLLSNAVKFTGSGGKIEVREQQEAAELFLSVSDTGAGLAPEVLPHVFDRFWQADSSTTRRVGGLGLGLALVRHIVELHGGAVEAQSDGLGKGSTFTIRLPIQAVLRPRPDSEPPAGAETATPIAGTLTGLRILVVDDEEDARDLIGSVLRDAGAVVETSASAREGFEAFKLFRPDVLVSDIAMADEDGFSLMRRVRQLTAAEGGTVPALALTAFARAEDGAHALAAGFTRHVGKPIAPDRLVATLSEFGRPARLG